jgi:flagellar M-ring protein FliF
MASNPPDILSQLKRLKNLSAGKIIALLILISAMIAGPAFLVSWAKTPDFQLLYSNLAMEDAGEIVAKLKDQKIPYQISSNGRSILIPKERVYEARLELANEGLPQGGVVGFEIFDETKLGMTEFVQNVNYQRALQGELSRTINGFTEVESSRIHIVMPTKSLFIENEEPPTASVVLKLRRGRRLSEAQVQGIVHLISASVSQLTPENVTIVDNYGKTLAGFKDESEIGKLSSDHLDFQEKVERGLEKRIESMLEKVLGPGKATTRISGSFDFRRREKTEEVYDREGQVVRSEQVLNTLSSKTGTTAMGVPGVVSDMTSVESGTNKPGGIPEFQKQDRTVNYEIGKVTSHTVEPVGKVKKLSVAVIVDGTYELAIGEDEWKYSPRTQEELTKIEDIVKRTVNFDAERGDEIEVVNIPFETAKLVQDEEEAIEEGWASGLKNYTSYMRYVFLGVFLFFTFMFVVRPLVRWLTSTPTVGAGILNQLPLTVEEIESGYGEGMKSMPHRDQALNMLANGDETFMLVAKDWLSEAKT